MRLTAHTNTQTKAPPCRNPAGRGATTCSTSRGAGAAFRRRSCTTRARKDWAPRRRRLRRAASACEYTSRGRGRRNLHHLVELVERGRLVRAARARVDRGLHGGLLLLGGAHRVGQAEGDVRLAARRLHRRARHVLLVLHVAPQLARRLLDQRPRRRIRSLQSGRRVLPARPAARARAEGRRRVHVQLEARAVRQRLLLKLGTYLGLVLLARGLGARVGRERRF
mmetsp:Transcript_14673/g.39102  ORF Transcript_14673/g.39102 Transcript_14673/m.39102 type:complete len:224 (+) Transcript_14673:238-909(+)